MPDLGEREDLMRLGIDVDMVNPDAASLQRTLMVYLVGFTISGVLLLTAYAFKWGWL